MLRKPTSTKWTNRLRLKSILVDCQHCIHEKSDWGLDMMLGPRHVSRCLTDVGLDFGSTRIDLEGGANMCRRGAPQELWNMPMVDAWDMCTEKDWKLETDFTVTLIKSAQILADKNICFWCFLGVHLRLEHVCCRFGEQACALVDKTPVIHLEACLAKTSEKVKVLWLNMPNLPQYTVSCYIMQSPSV